jgi:hypothetical protein
VGGVGGVRQSRRDCLPCAINFEVLLETVLEEVVGWDRCTERSIVGKGLFGDSEVKAFRLEYVEHSCLLTVYIFCWGDNIVILQLIISQQHSTIASSMFVFLSIRVLVA